MSEQQVMTAEKIAKMLPNTVLGQKIYKCKVVFMDVRANEEGYSNVKRFSANGNDYSVVDGGTSYLPEEAYYALTSAVSYIAKPKNKIQADYGIDMDNPDDRYVKIEIKRFDVTVIDILTFVAKENGSKEFVSSKEVISKEDMEKTKELMREAVKKEYGDEIREEIEEKIKVEAEKEITKRDTDIEKLKAKLKALSPDEDIDKLLEE